MAKTSFFQYNLLITAETTALLSLGITSPQLKLAFVPNKTDLRK